MENIPLRMYVEDNMFKLEANQQFFGSLDDHLQTKLVFTRPDSGEYDNDKLALRWFDVKNRTVTLVGNEFPLTRAFTQYPEITLVVIFYRAGEAIAHSNTLTFQFRENLRAEDSGSELLGQLAAQAFTFADYDGEIMNFYNITGDTLLSIPVSGGGGGTATKFLKPFALEEWIEADTLYELFIPKSMHGRNNPVVSVFRDNAGVSVGVDGIDVNRLANGDVILKSTDPFNGSVVIL